MEAKSKQSYKITSSQREEIASLYESGLSMNAVADKFGITTSGIKYILSRLNIVSRSTSEANYLRFATSKINDGLAPSTRSYRRRRAQGRCPTCRNGKPDPGKVRCEQCIEKSERTSTRRSANGLCPDCGKVPEGDYARCSTCLANKRSYYKRLKDEAVAAYGGKCACCGIADTVFLCLDHVNNNGSDHRREGPYYGPKIYLLAKRQNYPPEYQILCHNCNFAKQFGECPHKKSSV